jgi:ABC-type dipeptide/oligopeptide/nickel transport system permease component
MLLAMLGQSMPSFWLGLMFILFVALRVEWLPISGLCAGAATTSSG